MKLIEFHEYQLKSIGYRAKMFKFNFVLIKILIRQRNGFPFNNDANEEACHELIRYSNESILPQNFRKRMIQVKPNETVSE